MKILLVIWSLKIAPVGVAILQTFLLFFHICKNVVTISNHKSYGYKSWIKSPFVSDILILVTMFFYFSILSIGCKIDISTLGNWGEFVLVSISSTIVLVITDLIPLLFYNWKGEKEKKHEYLTAICVVILLCLFAISMLP